MKKAIIIGLGLAACSLASASDLFISGFATGKFRFVFTSFDGTSPITNTQAGAMSATLDGIQSFDAYCVDSLHAPLIGSSYPVTATALPNAGLANSARLAYLYETFAPTVDNADKGAGLQLALWDVLVDNGDGLSAGQFRASSVTTTMNQAAAYLSSSVGHSGSATWYQGVPGANQPQGLIGANPVPEPASLATLSIAAVALLRRRRKA